MATLSTKLSLQNIFIIIINGLNVSIRIPDAWLVRHNKIASKYLVTLSLYYNTKHVTKFFLLKPLHPLPPYLQYTPTHSCALLKLQKNYFNFQFTHVFDNPKWIEVSNCVTASNNQKYEFFYQCITVTFCFYHNCYTWWFISISWYKHKTLSWQFI